FEGQRYDVGENTGFVKTTIEYALKDKEMRNEIIHYLKSLDI
ncbi:UTP--glucose-1-phosphate uridylyltransferase, partial [Staphylococcus hominis]